MSQHVRSVKKAAEELGVSAKWVRRQIAAGVIDPGRAGTKSTSRFELTDADLEALLARRGESSKPGETTLLARITTLEADRANLLAHVAWAQATAKEQQKSLDFERQHAAELKAELAAQRARIEQLKALSAVDRLLGRHKNI